MVTWPVVRTRSSHLCPVRSEFVSLLLRALGVVQPGPGRVPGLLVHLEVDDNFCCSLQVVFQYSRLRALRSTLSQGVFTFDYLPLLASCLVPWKLWSSCVSCAKWVFPLFSYARLNPYTHQRAGRELGGGSSWLSYLTPYVNAVSECRWYEFSEDSCEDTDEEEDHCIAGQITDPEAIANTLASGQRGDGHGTARSLLSSPGVGGLTNDSCELPLCQVPFSSFLFSRVFLTSVTLTLEVSAGLVSRRDAARCNSPRLLRGLKGFRVYFVLLVGSQDVSCWLSLSPRCYSARRAHLHASLLPVFLSLPVQRER